MADTFTTNLVLTKPEIGSSEDTWGNKSNANWDLVDAVFTTGPAVKVENGGTGAVNASAARTNLGLGSLSTQNSDAVNITGGSATVGSVTVSGPSATITLDETEVSANSGKWRLTADNTNLILYTLSDTFSTALPAFSITRSGTTPLFFNVYMALGVNGNIVYHAGNISSAPIQEAQLVNADVFPRNSSTETITGQWNFSTVPARSGGGKFLHYASTSYTGGSVTVSTAAASGVPAASGDRWVQYI
jgi:hypothetical protein